MSASGGRWSGRSGWLAGKQAVLRHTGCPPPPSQPTNKQHTNSFFSYFSICAGGGGGDDDQVGQWKESEREEHKEVDTLRKAYTLTKVLKKEK